MDHAHHTAESHAHHMHGADAFRRKFWVSFVLSVPLIAYSDITATALHWSPPLFPGLPYAQMILASAVFFYGGWVFISSAYRELKARLPGMMTLIALAISVAYAYSIVLTFVGGTGMLYWELSTLITIMLLGHWMEMRAIGSAESALGELSKLLPDSAERLQDGHTETIPLSELRAHDRILVRPGGRIPADGLIEEGVSDVNESIATGESTPVSKKAGDAVIAGTTNGDGSLNIAVTRIGDDTFLAGIMRLVAEATVSKSRLQILSDRAAYYLTLIAVASGGGTLAVWLFLADPVFAVHRMVAVLVIACPHALGLAIPLVASISTAKAARNGFLIKQRLALEAARSITTVLFDKTGTLTRGEFGVDTVIPAAGEKETDVLRYAASVNATSEHPLAKAIVREARARNVPLLEAGNFQRIPGSGARADIEGAEIVVGSLPFAEKTGAMLDAGMKTNVAALARQGKTINIVIRNGNILGVIALADTIREESREAVRSLKAMGIQTALITGDTQNVAAWVAGELGINEYFAGVLPEQKSEKVKLLQSKGERVAMVGDGINDAPALTQANVGIAIGAGTNVAIESAGIILVKNDPRDIPKIITLSRLTYGKMLQNLFWATGYNTIAIPLAAGVLASKGILLSPALGAVLMSLSTVIVAVNAMLLRGKPLART